MGTGIYGGFGATLGSTYYNNNLIKETYTDRGINIPEELILTLSKLKKKVILLLWNQTHFL